MSIPDNPGLVGRYDRIWRDRHRWSEIQQVLASWHLMVYAACAEGEEPPLFEDFTRSEALKHQNQARQDLGLQPLPYLLRADGHRPHVPYVSEIVARYITPSHQAALEYGGFGG